MALRGTLTHRKTRRLAQALGIPPTFALGVLEALWEVTAKFRPRGDIGTMSNADIAMEMFYDGDPDALVSAILSAGFLDVSADYRLIVHDWHKHCDDTTDAKVARKAPHTYACGVDAIGRKLNDNERKRIAAMRNCAEGSTTAHNCAEGSTTAHNCALPEPEPEPLPVPEPKIKVLPAVKRQASDATDDRHVPCRELVHAYWLHRHPGDTCAPWDGSEAKALTRLLTAKPDLTAEGFHTLLLCRNRSDVNHDERPRAWLERITDYAGGPLDRFKLPAASARADPGVYVPTSEQQKAVDQANEEREAEQEKVFERWRKQSEEISA